MVVGVSFLIFFFKFKTCLQFTVSEGEVGSFRDLGK